MRVAGKVGDRIRVTYLAPNNGNRAFYSEGAEGTIVDHLGDVIKVNFDKGAFLGIRGNSVWAIMQNGTEDYEVISSD